MSEHPSQETQWPEHAVFTLGHSTLPIQRFIALLEVYGIERLVDIRTVRAGGGGANCLSARAGCATVVVQSLFYCVDIRMTLPHLLAKIRACRECADALPCGPRPVVQAHASARLRITGQAPGRKGSRYRHSLERCLRRPAAPTLALGTIVGLAAELCKEPSGVAGIKK